MSGVNAHALFEHMARTEQRASPDVPLQRQRYWAVPWPQKLAVKVHAAKRATYLCNLQAADSAYLLDHRVGAYPLKLLIAHAITAIFLGLAYMLSICIFRVVQPRLADQERVAGASGMPY